MSVSSDDNGFTRINKRLYLKYTNIKQSFNWDNTPNDKDGTNCSKFIIEGVSKELNIYNQRTWEENNFTFAIYGNKKPTMRYFSIDALSNYINKKTNNPDTPKLTIFNIDVFINTFSDIKLELI